VLARAAIVACIALASISRVAQAAPDPLAKPADAEARQHLQQGNKLYHLREFDKAVDEYKAGALREDAPVFSYNLGQCYRQLGKYEDAIWHYERFLSRAKPTGELRAAVEGFVWEMRDEMQRKAMTPPTDAAPADSTKPVDTSVGTTLDARSVQDGGERVAPWYADGLGWAMAGTGLLAAATSAYLLVNANDLDVQANAEDRQAVQQQLRSEASSRRTAGIITGVGAAGLLIAGVIKLAIHDHATSGHTAAVRVVITGTGVGLAGSF
jgi:tetratricopeptide (TPR) repeat protein